MRSPFQNVTHEIHFSAAYQHLWLVAQAIWPDPESLSEPSTTLTQLTAVQFLIA